MKFTIVDEIHTIAIPISPTLPALAARARYIEVVADELVAVVAKVAGRETMHAFDLPRVDQRACWCIDCSTTH